MRCEGRAAARRGEGRTAMGNNRWDARLGKRSGGHGRAVLAFVGTVRGWDRRGKGKEKCQW